MNSSIHSRHVSGGYVQHYIHGNNGDAKMH